MLQGRGGLAPGDTLNSAVAGKFRAAYLGAKPRPLQAWLGSLDLFTLTTGVVIMGFSPGTTSPPGTTKPTIGTANLRQPPNGGSPPAGAPSDCCDQVELLTDHLHSAVRGVRDAIGELSSLADRMEREVTALRETGRYAAALSLDGYALGVRKLRWRLAELLWEIDLTP